MGVGETVFGQCTVMDNIRGKQAQRAMATSATTVTTIMVAN